MRFVLDEFHPSGVSDHLFELMAGFEGGGSLIGYQGLCRLHFGV